MGIQLNSLYDEPWRCAAGFTRTSDWCMLKRHIRAVPYVQVKPKYAPTFMLLCIFLKCVLLDVIFLAKYP